MSNPLICNCNLKWLKDWLKQTNIATGNPQCTFPIGLKNQAVSTIEDRDFKCDSRINNDLSVIIDECDIETKASFSNVTENKCPTECSCIGSIVRCSQANLKKVPTNIPSNVKEL